jgi:Tol biopolymer transport system component
MSPFLRAMVLGSVVSLMNTTGTEQPVVVVRQALSHVSGNLGGGCISADGRFVAVVSMSQLVASDTNSVHDIYLLDRSTNVITLQTSALQGTSNGSSGHPDLSADGRYLVFDSAATNLTAGPDRNEVADIFLRNRLTGTARRLSVGPGGQEGNGKSETPAISSDGRVVAFVSSATNLVAEADRNGAGNDVFLARVETGEIVRVSVDPNGRQFAGALAPSLGDDGRIVAFTGREQMPEGASGGPRAALVPFGVYVRDIDSEVTTCISCGRSEARGRQAAFAPDVSDDGRIVTFVVQSGPHPLRTDVAVHDRANGVTTIVTRHANARSSGSRISGDGRFVVFESWASDLRCRKHCSPEEGDDNVLPDVYLFDRETSGLRRLSGSGRVWWSPSQSPGIDASGRAVIFSSRQPYGPEDTTVDFDLYVCDPACQ